MSAKWTEGPYKAVHSSWETSLVCGPDGTCLARVDIHPDVTEDTQDELEPIKDATATLFAAAPDLAEALTELLAWAQDFGESGDGGFFDFSEGELGKKCRAALAKAGAT